MNRKVVITFILFMSSLATFSQGFTLKKCIEYANKNNGDLKNAQLDVQISKKKVAEQIGTHLPQINISSELNDNLRLPTTLIPAEMLGGTPGTDMALTMGVKYTWSSGIQLSQSLFDPSYAGNLRSAKLNRKLSEQTQIQTQEQVLYNVSIAYYDCLVIQKQYNSQKATLESSEQSLKLLQMKYKNGMAKKIDLEKVQVSYNNTKSQLQQTILSYNQAVNIIKYRMGMPQESPLELADIQLDDYMNEIFIGSNPNDFTNRIDYQMKLTDIQLQESNKKLSKSAYLPNLSLAANYEYNAMKDNLRFFNSGKNWYSSSVVGLKLTIPIFDGLQKQSRVKQAKLNEAKSKENLHLTEQSIKLDIANYETNLKNAIDNIKTEKENFNLAQSVYKETQLQYQHGASTSLELVQAESSLREAQNNYYSKLLSYYLAKINLEKSKGTLVTFINNQI